MAVLALVGLRLVAGDAGSTPHWAFQRVQDPPLPAVRNVDWCRTSVDRFLLARLEAANVAPAREADRRTLIRRASLDLTGLPPTYREVEAFLADAAPGAWDRLVDRLLDSPRYGEHWGRHWLDVVRYADTAGETADYPVPAAWRYRDYVIAAFNADKPYDEFLREQIAGDILARRGGGGDYAGKVTATGYLAISRRFGFDSENYHHLTIQDTIDTLGQSVLGLTLGCARCHAHKYDPVSMRDYYALYGIFESTRYAFPGSEQKQKFRALVPLVPPDEARSRWRAYESELAGLAAMLEQVKKPGPSAVLRSLDDMDGDFEMQAPAAGGSKGVLVPPWVYEGPIAVTTEAQSPFKNLYAFGKVGASVAATTHSYRIRQALYPDRDGRFSGVIHVNLDFRVPTNGMAATRGAHRFWLGNAAGKPLFEVRISSGEVAVNGAGRTETLRSLDPDRWHNLQLAVDLEGGRWNGSVGYPGSVTPIAEHRLGGEVPRELMLVGLDSMSVAGESLPPILFDNLGVQGAPLAPVSTSRAESWSGPASGADPAELRKRMEALLADGPFAMAYAVSEGTPRDAHIQLRGDPDRLSEKVPRGFLEVLGGDQLRDDVPGSGRRELAEWLTRPDNPLTARVMVNRIWLYHFGRGLVTTPNDFGTRGQPPSHPQLLDHLATAFVRSGWSVKSMHRLIMQSAAYRQRSQETVAMASGYAAAPAADCPVAATETSVASPSNPGVVGTEWFSPFPRRRLQAEEIRDSILWVSGTMDVTLAGEHPFPAPTSWGFTQHGPFAATYDHRRRSVFLMNQRLKRHPFLALFDGPDPNASTAERRTTTVPTQALFFLNDPFVHESSEGFARRVLAASHDLPGRVDAAFRYALGRAPRAEEQAEAEDFLSKYREAWLRAGKGAEKVEDASYAALGRVLFAGNEFLTVD